MNVLENNQDNQPQNDGWPGETMDGKIVTLTSKDYVDGILLVTDTEGNQYTQIAHGSLLEPYGTEPGNKPDSKATKTTRKESDTQ